MSLTPSSIDIVKRDTFWTEDILVNEDLYPQDELDSRIPVPLAHGSYIFEGLVQDWDHSSESRHTIARMSFRAGVQDMDLAAAHAEVSFAIEEGEKARALEALPAKVAPSGSYLVPEWAETRNSKFFNDEESVTPGRWSSFWNAITGRSRHQRVSRSR